MSAPTPRSDPSSSSGSASASTTNTSPASTPAYRAVPEHAYWCCAVLEAELSRGKMAVGGVPFEPPEEDYPLFVTWDKYTSAPPKTTTYRVSSLPTALSAGSSTTSLDSEVAGEAGTSGGRAVPFVPPAPGAKEDEGPEAHLRGCIGTFAPMPLAGGLRQYAITAAIHDTRFNPITSKELPLLRCSVSLLTPFEPISDPLDWDLTQHGVHLTFSPPSSRSASGRRYSATYLPGVALEQGWSRSEALLSLVRKAGYERWREVREGDEVWRGMRVKRYESLKVEVGWGEYVAWKSGVGRA